MSIGNFIQGAIGGGSVGSAFGPWGTGIGAVLGGVGSVFGGGGGSSGGGGGMDMKALQKALAAPKFLGDYTENLFNLDSNFGSGDYDRLLNAMDAGKVDKYQVMNIFGQQGLNAGDKDYFDAMTSTIGKKRGRELASAVGQSMFRGATPTRKQTKDAYKYALLTGNTGTPQEAQQAISSYFAQTPEGMRNRMPSSQELLAGMKYGPLVGTDSGVFLFGGTDRTNKMFDRLDDARSYRSQKIHDIYNT
jgi:hypothetical protein